MDPRHVLRRHLPQVIQDPSPPTGAPQPTFDPPEPPHEPERHPAPEWPTFDPEKESRHGVHPEPRRGPGPDRRKDEEIGRELDDRPEPTREPTGDKHGVEVCAWYQPFHVYDDWGIFVREKCVERLFYDVRRRLRRSVPGALGRPTTPPEDARIALTALRLAFSRYYLHEVFHHQAEAIATRMEVVTRESVYLPGTRALHKARGGDPEEPLAEAYTIGVLGRRDHMSWRGFEAVVPFGPAQTQVRRDTQELIRTLVATTTPPPYNRGASIRSYRAAALPFHEEVMRTALGPSGWWTPASDPRLWRLASHMVRGYRRQDDVGFWIVTPKGATAPSWLPSLRYPWG